MSIMDCHSVYNRIFYHCSKVVTLNGPDSLAKLIKLRLEIKAGDYKKSSTTPCFYIIGRVRMRMGFNWSVATIKLTN
jgi:hypothetical protein